jgi:hypothetical protein
MQMQIFAHDASRVYVHIYIYMHIRISQRAYDKIIFLRNAWHRRRYVLSSRMRYVRRLIAYKSNRVLTEVATGLLLARFTRAAPFNSPDAVSIARD